MIRDLRYASLLEGIPSTLSIRGASTSSTPFELIVYITSPLIHVEVLFFHDRNMIDDVLPLPYLEDVGNLDSISEIEELRVKRPLTKHP